MFQFSDGEPLFTPAQMRFSALVVRILMAIYIVYTEQFVWLMVVFISLQLEVMLFEMVRANKHRREEALLRDAKSWEEEVHARGDGHG